MLAADDVAEACVVPATMVKAPAVLVPVMLLPVYQLLLRSDPLQASVPVVPFQVVCRNL
jgi:hypothetical protein